MYISRSLWKNADHSGEVVINPEGVYVCNLDPAFPIEVGFDVHDNRHKVRMNRHDSFEVIYVYEGKGFVQIQGRRFPISRGNLAVVGPNLYHQFLSCPSTRLKLAFLHFQSQVLLGGAGGEEVQYLAPFLCRDERFPFVIPPSTRIPDEVLELILKISKELPPSNDVGRLAAKTYLKVLLLLLLRHYQKYVTTKESLEYRRRDIRRLDPLFQFIDQHSDRSLRAAEAARLCGMSHAQFVRSFTKITGQSLGDYLKHFRVAKAQSLLSTTDTTIAEISGLLGFCSQSHFGLVFRRLAGITPLKYRRRYGKNPESEINGKMQDDYHQLPPNLGDSNPN